MNFYKVRQKDTGLFFCGGRQSYVGPSFTGAGMRYETIATASAGRNFCTKWNTKRQSYQREITGLSPENFEIVEFQEVEVAIIPKKK